MKQKRISKFAGLAVLIAVCLFAAALFSQITVYCDDYLYGTFFKHGSSGFWELTRWHFENYNGRIFVHFMAQLTLLADRYLYMLLAPAMLAVVFGLGQAMQRKGAGGGLTLAASGAAVAGVMALPVNFLSSSILWISAGFNYLFPLAVILPALWLLRRDLEAGRVRVWTLILCFLCGATTEQSGLAAMVLLGGYALLRVLRGETPLGKAIWVPALIALGYVTIFLAPGTWVRVGNETGGGILKVLQPSVLIRRLAMSLEYFTGASGLPWLFVVFAALTALHALITGDAPKVLTAGFGVGALYLLFRALHQPFVAACLGVLWIFVAAVGYLFRRETAIRGLLLGAALASLLVMVFTTTAAERTTVPSILLVMCVCASLFCECAEKIPRWAGLSALAALAAVLLVLALPTYRGYAGNAPIWRENERQLRSHGDLITLDMDVDRRYGHTSYFENLAFLHYAMDYYGVTDEKIVYVSAANQVAGSYGVDARRAGLAIYLINGVPYVPIQDTVQLAGGESEWDHPLNGTWAKLGEREYVFRTNGEVVPFDLASRTVTGEVTHTDVRAPVYTFYAPMDVMGELFGLSWDYNEAENIYYLRKER